MKVHNLTNGQKGGNCERCGHPLNKHAFDIVMTDRPNPCQLSCMLCFDTETERLKQEGLLK